MKTNLKRLTLISTYMLVMSSAHAYKYVIYTDDVKTDKAEQISELMKKTYPFSKFDIEVEIVRLQPQELNCKSENGIERLIMCSDSVRLQEKALKSGADQAMILKDSTAYGGSSHVGGGVPVITTATDTRAMLHEYMHTLGLCDEYEYKASEATIYCGDSSKSPNAVFIEPLDPYSTDSMARARHMGQIPWFGEILPTTPITNTQGTRLGTGDVDFTKRAPINTTDTEQALFPPTGLYRGKICNQAVPKKVSWHPGAGATIMENTSAGLGVPLEKVVEKLLISKGVKKKLQYADELPEPSRQESAGSVVVTPEPLERINNTARSFFKSFFSWAQEAIENVKKVFGI